MTRDLSHFQCVFSLGLGVISDFNKLRIDTQAKNIAAWMPVISIILQGFVRLDEKAVSRLFSCLRRKLINSVIVWEIFTCDIPIAFRTSCKRSLIRGSCWFARLLYSCRTRPGHFGTFMTLRLS